MSHEHNILMCSRFRFLLSSNISSRGVMATRLTSNQKIVGSTPTVSALLLNFLFLSYFLKDNFILVN